MLLWTAWADEWALNERVSFNGTSRLITVNAGVTDLDIRTHVWSALTRWLAAGNDNYTKGMRRTGFDTIPGGVTGDSYFMVNSWKLVIDITKVKVTGVLWSDDYPSAYFTPDLVQVYPVQVSALVNTVFSTQNIVSGIALNAAETADAVWNRVTRTTTDAPAPSVADIWAHAIEGLTAEEIMRVTLAVLAGKVSGAGSGVETFKGVDGTVSRVVSTVDSAGNRTEVTVNGA